jgi:hypothetical protein
VSAPVREALEAALWPDDQPSTPFQVYALLDGARDDRIAVEVASSGLEHASLLPGAPKALADAGPHLVALRRGSPLVAVLANEGWGKCWGLFLASPHPFETVRRELRKLLRVETPDGRRMFFRFYDPRVLRVFLPTCTPSELRSFFDLVPFYFLESAAGDEVVRFHREASGLAQRVVGTVS